MKDVMLDIREMTPQPRELPFLSGDMSLVPKHPNQESHGFL